VDGEGWRASSFEPPPWLLVLEVLALTGRKWGVVDASSTMDRTCFMLNAFLPVPCSFLLHLSRSPAQLCWLNLSRALRSALFMDLSRRARFLLEHLVACCRRNNARPVSHLPIFP